MTSKHIARPQNKKKFYDPLYQLVHLSSFGSAEKKLRELAFGSPAGQRPFQGGILDDVIGSYEFSRLNFLHQAGLCWLIFPSATHTRFAHSLGCWHLAERAAESVVVQRPGRGSPQRGDGTRKGDLSNVPDLLSLKECMKEAQGWDIAFNVALLLHDLGHFPFSHVIENNDELAVFLKKEENTRDLNLNHEDVGQSLILGEGPAHDLLIGYLKHRLGDEFDENRLISNALQKITDYVDTNQVCYLLDPIRNKDLVNKKDISILKPFLGALHDLISGVIDIDRLDHYRRDSFFTSFGRMEFNVEGLLHNLVIFHPPAKIKEKPNGERFLEHGFVANKSAHPSAGFMTFQIVHDGIEHAFQMLYTKNKLTNAVFNHLHNVAYEVMINKAITVHWKACEKIVAAKKGGMKQSKDFMSHLIFYDDGEMLAALMGSESKLSQILVQRVKRQAPYICAGRFRLKKACFNGDFHDPAVENLGPTYEKGDLGRETRRLMLDKFNTLSDGNKDGDILIRLDKNFAVTNPKGDWLDLERIYTENLRPLEEVPERKAFLDYLKTVNESSARTFWLFCKDESLVPQTRGIGQQLGGVEIEA